MGLSGQAGLGFLRAVKKLPTALDWCVSAKGYRASDAPAHLNFPRLGRQFGSAQDRDHVLGGARLRASSSRGSMVVVGN